MSTRQQTVCDACGKSEPSESAYGRWYSMSIQRAYTIEAGSLGASLDACGVACTAKLLERLKGDVEKDAASAEAKRAEHAREAKRRNAPRVFGKALGEVLGEDEQQ